MAEQRVVISDGSIYLCSPVDPLFLALIPLELGSRRTDDEAGVFQEAEQIFQAEGAEGGRELQEAVKSQLPLICDCKTVGDETYYRLSKQRVLAWLRVKTERTIEALKPLEGFSGMARDGLEAYAVGLLGEYLSPGWLATLREQYNLDVPVESPIPLVEHKQQDTTNLYANIEKKRKLSMRDSAREKAREAREEKRAAQIKRETVGMKKLSSFFTPASKKK